MQLYDTLACIRDLQDSNEIPTFLTFALDRVHGQNQIDRVYYRILSFYNRMGGRN